MQELTGAQVVSYYGMYICVAVLFLLLVAENFILKRRVKMQHDLIMDMKGSLEVGDKLIGVLRTTNLEYLSVLRQAGFIKDEEKPKLDG